MSAPTHGGETLRAIRKKLRLTQEDMAKAVGAKNLGQYKNWEYKLANPPEQVVDKAETLLFTQNQGQPGLLKLRRMPMTTIRLVGSVSAGDGASDHEEEMEASIPAHMGGDDVAGWRAEGDSMMPWIQPRDIILARESKERRPNLAHLVRTREGIRVKMLVYDQGKGWQYHSLNPSYPDEPLKDEDEIIGYVTGLYRFEGGTEIIINNWHGLRPTT